MLPAKVLGFDVVDRQIAVSASAILACEIIASKYFFSGQFDLGSRFVYHALQPDYRGPGKGCPDRVNFAAAILH